MLYRVGVIEISWGLVHLLLQRYLDLSKHLTSLTADVILCNEEVYSLGIPRSCRGPSGI